MVKNFCDICGEEIGDWQGTRFKLKREWNNWYEWGWENLHVHKECWVDLCKYIRERRTDGKTG
jgi:hypothetical protein